MSGGNGTKILVRPRKGRIVAGALHGRLARFAIGPAETLSTGQVPTLTTA
jgi:hypothetical protein